MIRFPLLYKITSSRRDYQDAAPPETDLPFTCLQGHKCFFFIYLFSVEIVRFPLLYKVTSSRGEYQDTTSPETDLSVAPLTGCIRHFLYTCSQWKLFASVLSIKSQVQEERIRMTRHPKLTSRLATPRVINSTFFLLLSGNDSLPSPL